MGLIYDVAPLPAVWPGPKVTPRRSPFKTQWTKTLDMLAREIRHLHGAHVEFAVDVRGARDINQNGALRADARPAHRVIVSFRLPSGKRLQFPCGTFAFWQDNVYAIAKALEALRMVERYGVSSTSQYEGFKQLPSSAAPTMSTEAAAKIISDVSDVASWMITADREHAKTAVRTAMFRTHPDRNLGDRSKFDSVDAARRGLSSHHGVSL